MRKIHLLGLALFAVFALSSYVATAAFAVTEFLVGGSPAVEGQPFHAEGELELTDLSVPILGEVTVKCSGLVEGLFKNANDALIEKVFNLSETQLTELAGGVSEECENVKNCPSALVFPENLPWLAEIVLNAAGEFLLHLTSDEEGTPKFFPGWDVVCMGILGEPSALCEGLVTGLVKNNPTEHDFDTIFVLAEQEAEKELGNCFEGTTEHKEVGHVDGTILALEVEGLEISVS